MFMHSASEGLTLPGIIDEPACTAGIPISASPATGPEAISLMSFAILFSSTAKLRRAPDRLTTAYLLCKACCISFSGFSGNFDIFASSLTATFLYPFGVFAPVPTAVAPSATNPRCFCVEVIDSLALVIDVA